MFLVIFFPRNTSEPQQHCYTDIATKTYRNGFFFKPQKSETKLEMKPYLPLWAVSYWPFKKSSYQTQQMLIYIGILLTFH